MTFTKVTAPAKLVARLVQERMARGGARARKPEPMAMDEHESVLAFHTADPVLQLPTYRLNALAISALLPADGRLLDLGSGTGQLLAHLARARPDVTITGTDLAPNMLAVGRQWLAEAGLDDRIALREADMTALPEDVVGDHVDVVSCVWALHHLPTDDHVRRCLAQISRIRQATGAAVWIFDFARFKRPATFPALMAFAPDAPERLVQDGIASERAAWTDYELRQWLDEAGLRDLGGGRDRKIGWCQAYFAEGRRPPAHATQWVGEPLSGAIERDVRQTRKALPAFPGR